MKIRIPSLVCAITIGLGLFPRSSQAAVFIQELFDNISDGNSNLNGAGSDVSTIGLTGTWVVSTPGIDHVMTANNFNSGPLLPGLPPQLPPEEGGAQGGVWWSNPSTWNTGIYATRSLETAINFNSDQVIYFSVHLNNVDDTAAGIGLASGADPSSSFVGAGLTWNTAHPISDPAASAANSAYIGYGTLDTDGGAYGIQAFQGAGTTNGQALIVGQIILSSSGLDTINIVRYLEGDTIADDLSTIEWSATASFDSQMVATELLLFVNGNGKGEVDAIRFGETWEDVTGVAAVPEPSSLGYVAITAFGTAVLLLRRRRGC